ncbi:APC family permease [Microbacterium marinilacus]|uniref:APC family permease n=1 Tax=Microbacterium marinilacus TaxID=415209 RepID=A0ABP7B6C7_9MICO|nr:APC family permease [Microbacterium marinilacus]MBY0689985.1 APC family permease [Microbacterium marinilacus]
MTQSTQTGEPGLITQVISNKGLAVGAVGLFGATVIGVSTVAPAYTSTASIGLAAAEVGEHAPAVILLGLIPMLLVALGYRELNRVMPDSGTTFTWATRAFGPWVGWMASWGLVIATILVLSNLAAVAVDFLFLLISQLTGNAEIANLTRNPFVNVAVCLLFMLGATYLSYRDMKESKVFQVVLVVFQVAVLLLFAGLAIGEAAAGDAPHAIPFDIGWFNPLGVSDLGAIVAGLSVSIFIFWGWDVTLTMNEETTDPERTPGRAAALTVVIVGALYLLLTVASVMFAGVGDEPGGLLHEDVVENVFFGLADSVMGPWAFLISLAVLVSSVASLQSTIIGPARTLLAMGHYGALPAAFDSVNPRHKTPVFAIIVSTTVASAFYVVMRFVSENVLWDTILTLGMMICFYYGLTAFACVWFFRHQWLDSAGAFLTRFLAPLIGGVTLLAMFVMTLRDSFDPDYGSGANIGGVGIVGILGVVILLLGGIIMAIMAVRRPAFFRGEILPMQSPASQRTTNERTNR